MGYTERRRRLLRCEENAMVSRRLPLILAGSCSAVLLGGSMGEATPRATTGQSVPAATRVQQHAVHQGWLSSAARKQKLLYVSDYTESLVLIYAQGAEGSGPIGEIVNGLSSPQGIAVDKSGTLYVANQGNNTVTEYPAGSIDPSVILSTDISEPLDVSVDSNGVLYVGESSADTILEFRPGSTSPDTTISVTHPSELTNSKNDDLYLTYNLHFSSNGGYVEHCKPLKTKCKNRGISTGFAQGIAIDSKGNLLVGDVYNEVIDIFAPGQTSPSRTIATKNQEPGKLALDATDTTLYMADPANFAVELYDYATGTQTGSFTYGPADELEGVALFPGQKPGR